MTEIITIDLDDAARLASLHRAAFGKGWSAAEFQKHINNEFDDVIGRLDKGKVIAFAVLRTQSDQSELLTIVVDPAYRGRDIGHNLLSEAERCVVSRGADIMFLEVAADNTVATALYQKLGYVRCGTRKGYYRRVNGRIDAHLFQKRL
ncbi:MAG: ribosomal-protein-alanine N-acetyltransferase [Acidimicrobiales bacterium]|nr:ribosomal protein S18-alanine N-acetyltransferase [Hyphomonadaceae bacterium]RZV45079.1 MAG: ribosomal-protein-alanine N-acetyltransferase [Acidimicrobiales bacterium]